MKEPLEIKIRRAETKRQRPWRPATGTVSWFRLHFPILPSLLRCLKALGEFRNLVVFWIIIGRLLQQSLCFIGASEQRQQKYLLNNLIGVSWILAVASLMQRKCAFISRTCLIHLAQAHGGHSIAHPSLCKLRGKPRRLFCQRSCFGIILRVKCGGALCEQLLWSRNHGIGVRRGSFGRFR